MSKLTGQTTIKRAGHTIILKLDEIGQTRNALNTAQNRLQSAQRTAAAQVQSSRDTLQLHLQVATVRAEDFLEAVNKRRKVLNLPEIEELTADTKLDTGLSAAAKTPEFNKQSALRDLKAVSDATNGLLDLGKAEAAAIVSSLAKLEVDPALLAALQRRSFIEKGLDLVDGSECPLCDHPWDNEQHVREHLKAKLAKSEEARKLQEALLDNGMVRSVVRSDLDLAYGSPCAYVPIVARSIGACPENFVYSDYQARKLTGLFYRMAGLP